MATSIMALKVTPQGTTNVQDICKRAAAFKGAVTNV
jgi:uncharacterized protein with GYD domain